MPRLEWRRMRTDDSAVPASSPAADPPRFRPEPDVLSGENADVYFERAARILAAEGIDPVVSMEIFCRAESAVLCGAAETLAYLRAALGPSRRHDPEPVVESLADGDRIGRKEVVMRITARYSDFGLYETAILGIFSQSTGWATAARRVVDAAAPIPVIGFGARHVHPSIADQMDYASVVGGCIGASTPAGARLAGLAPTGTMPHALVLIFGDTVRAAEAFDRHIEPEVPRIVLVDTFKDEAEESLRVADALGERLWGVRLDTPSERGRVTADLVKEVRARLDLAGHERVRIVVSGGIDVERILYFKEAGAPVDSFAVGGAISDARPDRLHRRPQGDRRAADRQARPDPGPDRQSAPAARRPGRLTSRPHRTTLSGPMPPDQPRDDERESAYELFQRGSRLLEEDHPGAAAVLLERALRLEPGKASILEALGRAYFNQGQPDLAAERFEAIVEADPLAHYAHFGLGLAAKRLGHRSVAARHLRMATVLAPDNEDYRRALRRLGDVA